VGVGPDDQVTRPDVALLDEHLVTDAVADLVLVCAVLAGERPDAVVVVGRLDPVRRGVVVDGEHHVFR
jgi:hypothetical protein